jgi:signal transduction histidine kinase
MRSDLYGGDIMGGDVTVTSEPGKGSVFTMRLPSASDAH